MDQPETLRHAMNMMLHINGAPVVLEGVTRGQGELSFTFSGKSYLFRGYRLPDGTCVLERKVGAEAWQRLQGAVWQGKGIRHVQLGALDAALSVGAGETAMASVQAELSPRAPMPGVVRKILVVVGEKVEEGQALAVMEAMKLQTTLSAGAAATVEAIMVHEGELVAEGAELVRLKVKK